MVKEPSIYKMPALKHLHTYERMNRPKDSYFRCIHPDCTHYIHKSLLSGKRASCSCGEEFILTLDDLKLKNPHCAFCGKNPQPRIEDEAIEEYFAPIEEGENDDENVLGN